jgi:topoisomerase-4 subunit B
VRDYGRGMPLGKLMECAAQINTGAKYDSEVFKRSVGLNGVGIKAVNALSEFFEIQAIREKQTRSHRVQPGTRGYDMGKPKPSTEEPTARASSSGPTRSPSPTTRTTASTSSARCCASTPG